MTINEVVETEPSFNERMDAGVKQAVKSLLKGAGVILAWGALYGIGMRNETSTDITYLEAARRGISAMGDVVRENPWYINPAKIVLIYAGIRGIIAFKRKRKEEDTSDISNILPSDDMQNKFNPPQPQTYSTCHNPSRECSYQVSGLEGIKCSNSGVDCPVDIKDASSNE
jgi:hypothetical protein